MQPVEAEEDDKFEILDFTTSSPWEKFVADVEDIFVRWGIGRRKGKKQFSSLNPSANSPIPVEPSSNTVLLSPEQISLTNLQESENTIKTDLVNYDNYTFQLTYVNSDINSSVWDQLQSPNNDFLVVGNDIEKWFGLRQFVVISSYIDLEKSTSIYLPSSSSATDEIDEYTDDFSSSRPLNKEVENKVKVLAESSLRLQKVGVKSAVSNWDENIEAQLLSTLTIVASSCGCTIPLFVQRISETTNQTLSLQSAMTSPSKAYTASMFEANYEKGNSIGCALEAMRSTHFSSELLSCELALARGFDWVKESLVQLIGTKDLPPEDLSLHTRYTFSETGWGSNLWKEIPKNNLYYSKWGTYQDPVEQFKLILEWSEDAYCRKSKVCDAASADKIILFCKFLDKSSICYFSRGLCLLQLLLADSSSCTIPQLIPKLESQGKTNLIGSKSLTKANIISILDQLFESNSQETIAKSYESFNFPSAAPGTLISELALRIFGLQSAIDIYSLWINFVGYLRECWENKKPIPRTEKLPIFENVLIAQKIQLLEYCIEQYNQQVAVPVVSSNLVRKVSKLNDDYIDINMGNELDSESEDEAEGNNSKDSKEEITMIFTGQSMVIPERQKLGVETSDMIQERKDLLDRIGTSDEVAVIRAKIETPLIYSDMQGFKHSNPGALFEDFIRWYSPEDWVDENGNPTPVKNIKGKLSKKMEGNCLWKRMWDEVKPARCADQVKIFDLEKEANKALNYLESINSEEMIIQVLSVGFVAFYHILCPSNEAENIKDINAASKVAIPASCKRLCSILSPSPMGRHQPVLNSARRVFRNILNSVNWPYTSTVDSFDRKNKTILKAFSSLEFVAAEVTSLSAKFPQNSSLVSLLLDSGLCPITTNDDWIPAWQIFGPKNKNSQEILYREPNLKEYVVRCFTPGRIAGDYTTAAPPMMHRLYAKLMPMNLFGGKNVRVTFATCDT